MNDRQTTAFLVAAVAAFLLYLNNRKGQTGASQLQEVLGVIRGATPGTSAMPSASGSAGTSGTAPFILPPRPGVGAAPDQTHLMPGTGQPVSFNIEWLPLTAPGNAFGYA